MQNCIIHSLQEVRNSQDIYKETVVGQQELKTKEGAVRRKSDGAFLCAKISAEIKIKYAGKAVT